MSTIHFSDRFPSHDVVIVGQEWQDCLSCQIRLFAHTDVLVATHGAGITNMVGNTWLGCYCLDCIA